MNMKHSSSLRILLVLVLVLVIGFAARPAQALAAAKQKRIFIVSSYDRNYIWSQSTQSGVNAAMLKLGYLETDLQARQLVSTDMVQSDKVVVKKVWMDTKRKSSSLEIARTTTRVMAQLREFSPDVVLLGDDNAANYIGNQLLDSKIPVVFWGINGLPLKYDLIKSMDAPGRNVTGVWQSGYHKESLDLLKRLVPAAKTFAILACDSETTRPNVKMIEQLAMRGLLPFKLVGKVVTNSLDEWKSGALKLAETADVLFVLNHDTLRDAKGDYVDMLTAGRWYLNNIKKPEASHEDQFVKEGMLLTANDSGYNQGFWAFEMAYGILELGLSPASMAVRTPDRGPYLVNRNRAKALGISIDEAMYLIDELVDKSLGR
jgi:ABC-type uncharacterized transport system substrate-binding protein